MRGRSGYFHELFNFNFDVNLHVFGELLVDGEWSVWEEEVDGDVIVDAEQVTGC